MAIQKGTPAARASYGLFEAWTAWTQDQLDESEAEAAFQGAMAYATEVVYNLIVIVGGVINAVAIQARHSFEEVRATVWQQMATANVDNHDAQVMRAAVTAWTSGSAEDADYVNESGMLAAVEPRVLMMHFLAMWTMLARTLANNAGEPFESALEDLRGVLGIEQ